MKKALLFLLMALLFSCNPKRQPATIPAEAIPVTYDGNWIFPMMLNDSIPGNFVFDTGCRGLLLDSLYFSNIPIDTTGKIGKHTLYGAGEGKQETIYVMGPLSSRIDTLDYILPYTIIVQLKPYSGKSSDGVMGWDYLQNLIVEFNVDGQYIRLLPPDSIQNLNGYEQIPLSHDGNWWYITAKVSVTEDVQIDGEFLFDVGSGSNIWFTTAIAKQNNFATILSDTIVSVGMAGFGGKSESVSFRAKAVTIGNFEIKKPILLYSKDTAGLLSVGDYKGFYRNHNGLLGAELLARFNMIIDFPHQQLYLRKAEQFDKRDKINRRGFGYADRTDICDGFVVRSLAKEQNAEKAGVQLGDIITHINKKSVKELSEEKLEQIWTHAKSITLTIQRAGDTLQIKLPLTDKNI